MVHVPDRIAHFLEHKLFEKADGDVFQDFSKQGLLPMRLRHLQERLTFSQAHQMLNAI